MADAAKPLADELEVLYVGAGHCVCARFANMALQVWFGAAREVDAVALATIADRLSYTFPGGISSIHWLPRELRLPGAAPRRIIADVLRRHGAWMGEVAMIVDGQGFWMGALRSMLTGIRLAAGPAAGFRVSRTLDDCVLWLPKEHARRTGVQVEAASLRDAFWSLRSNHADDDHEAV